MVAKLSSLVGLSSKMPENIKYLGWFLLCFCDKEVLYLTMAVFDITLYTADLRKTAAYRVIPNTAIVRYKTSLSQKHNENHPTLVHYFGVSKCFLVLFFRCLPFNITCN